MEPQIVLQHLLGGNWFPWTSSAQDDRLKSLADKTSGVGKFQQVVMEECIVLGSNVPVGESPAVYNDIGDVLNKVGDIVHVEGVQDSVQVGDGSWRQQSVVSSGHSVEDSTWVGSHEGERMAREARRNAGDIGMNEGGSSVNLQSCNRDLKSSFKYKAGLL
ncbi:hypothetical protein Q3G72_000335 [Acer saccharum]|nr:hypothetical protein Q3G72_000335 [Acer saccharum]